MIIRSQAGAIRRADAADVPASAASDASSTSTASQPTTTIVLQKSVLSDGVVALIAIGATLLLVAIIFFVVPWDRRRAAARKLAHSRPRTPHDSTSTSASTATLAWKYDKMGDAGSISSFSPSPAKSTPGGWDPSVDAISGPPSLRSWGRGSRHTSLTPSASTPSLPSLPTILSASSISSMLVAPDGPSVFSQHQRSHSGISRSLPFRRASSPPPSSPSSSSMQHENTSPSSNSTLTRGREQKESKEQKRTRKRNRSRSRSRPPAFEFDSSIFALPSSCSVSMPETACFTMPVRPPRPERDAGIGMGMRVGVGVASPLRSEWPDYPEWEVPEREHKRADSIKLLLHDHASDTETTLGNHPFTRHGSCDFSANTCGSSSDQSHGHSLSHNYGHGHGYTTSIGASTISSPLANGFSVPAVPLRPPPRPRRPSVPAV